MFKTTLKSFKQLKQYHLCLSLLALFVVLKHQYKRKTISGFILILIQYVHKLI